MVSNRAAFRLHHIVLAKMHGQWNKPYRLHTRIRSALEMRARLREIAREREQEDTMLRAAIANLKSAVAELQVAEAPEPTQPLYIQ